MNSGIIHGEMLKHETKEDLINYLSKLNLTADEKNKHYVYWKSCIIRSQTIKQMRIT